MKSEMQILRFYSVAWHVLKRIEEIQLTKRKITFQSLACEKNVVFMWSLANQVIAHTWESVSLGNSPKWSFTPFVIRHHRIIEIPGYGAL